MDRMTREDIRGCLSAKVMPPYDEDAGKPVSHMLMVCDTFSYEDYPVYVAEGRDVNEVIKRFGVGYNRVMEVYSYGRDLEDQLREHRAWHPEGFVPDYCI